MYAGEVLNALDVLNISVSGFVLVVVELAILFCFVNLMSWGLRKIQKTDQKTEQ